MAGPPGVTFVPAVAALDELSIEIWERLREEVLAKREPTYSSMLQAVATPTCAKRSRPICAITEVRAVTSRPDHHHCRNTAGNDDKGNGSR